VREESEHDAFGASHAATSISAALGMAMARDLKEDDSHVVAIIGDGALTCGMAYEAINNAGHLGTRLTVVLNDNAMSIAPNVGAISHLLNRLRAHPRYTDAKDGVEQALQHVPVGGSLMLEAARRVKGGIREVLLSEFSSFWEGLGFTYLGPIDGHNIAVLEQSLSIARQSPRPVVLHVVTRKGKGYEQAEEDSRTWHGISAGGGTKKSSGPSYSGVFGDTLCELASDDPRVVAITAAMVDGTGLKTFAARFPQRFFDVGIAESHAVTFAAGLATQGMLPVAAIYSTFLQRAYDQIIHDVCIQGLHVVFALDRAGIVGDDGRTQHGMFDYSYLRPLPGMVVMAPKDEDELRHMLASALTLDGPVALRFPRGNALGVPMEGPPCALPVGKGETLCAGDDLALVAIGSMVAPAREAVALLAQEGVRAELVNARFVKPLDCDLLLDLARRHERIITVEENVLMGGFGAAVAELFTDVGVAGVSLVRLGIPDHFVEHGSQARLRDELDLSAAGIVRRARAHFPALFVSEEPAALAG
jgi:1-deoxy-D-xylulose-5-phosphate synthase